MGLDADTPSPGYLHGLVDIVRLPICVSHEVIFLFGILVSFQVSCSYCNYYYALQPFRSCFLDGSFFTSKIKTIRWFAAMHSRRRVLACQEETSFQTDGFSRPKLPFICSPIYPVRHTGVGRASPDGLHTGACTKTSDTDDMPE